MVGCPGQERRERVGLCLAHRRTDELGLAAVTVRWQHHPTRRRRRDLAAERLAHQVQRGVDAGGRSGTRQDVAVLHVEHIGPHDGLRVHACHEIGVAPVGRALAAVEEPGLGQGERPRAVGVHDRPALVGRLSGFDHERAVVCVQHCTGFGALPPRDCRRYPHTIAIDLRSRLR